MVVQRAALTAESWAALMAVHSVALTVVQKAAQRVGQLAVLLAVMMADSMVARSADKLDGHLAAKTVDGSAALLVRCSAVTMADQMVA